MEFSEIFRFVASLTFILGLIGVCAYVAKRMGLATGAISTTGTQKRLSIVEVKVVDAKHRLVLMRRDNREHLVLLGGENDLLIESGIEVPDISPSEISAQQNMTAAAPIPQFQKIVEFIKERRA
jgi:flagellar protein FliO/FliZ